MQMLDLQMLDERPTFGTVNIQMMVCSMPYLYLVDHDTQTLLQFL